METLMDVDQVAKMYNLKKSWIYLRMFEAGHGDPLPIPRKKIGKYSRFTKDEMDGWLSLRMRMQEQGKLKKYPFGENDYFGKK